MNHFLSKHGRKVALVAAIGGITSFSLVSDGTETSIAYANDKNIPVSSEDVLIEGEVAPNEGDDINASDLISDINASDLISDIVIEGEEAPSKGGFLSNLLSKLESDAENVKVDVTFITREYKSNTPMDEWDTVSRVAYEVQTVDGKPVGKGVSDENGVFVVKDLPVGNYKWIRTSAPNKYDPMDSHLYFSIDIGDTERVINSNVAVKRDDDLFVDSEGNIVDKDGNRLDVDGNIIPDDDIIDGDIPIEDDEVLDEDKPSEDDEITDEDKPSDDEVVDEDKPSDDEITDEDKPSDDEVVDEGKPSDDDEITDEDKPSDDEVVDEDKPSEDDNAVGAGGKDNKDDNKGEVSNSKSEGKKVDEAKPVKGPEDVKTYDGGVLSFFGLAIASAAGFIALNRKKDNS